MFLKPFRVKSNTQLKGSDKKKFRADVQKEFPMLQDQLLQLVYPSKSDVVITKVYAYKGESVSVYVVDKEPLFFRMDKEPGIYPTVYFLWKVPELLKTFSTHADVVPRLCQGADLMLPGIVLPDKQIRVDSYGKFGKGKVVAVNTIKNICPVAVGKTAHDSYDLYMAARQGKGVLILHTYRDHLWEMGSKSQLVEISPGNNQQEEEYSDPELNAQETLDEDASEELGSLNLKGNTEEEPLSESESMDRLLEHCFIKAWKTTAKKLELPVLTSNFFRLHMIPNCPDGFTLDVKKSSHKKLSKYLSEMARRGLIEVKEFPKGVENITGVRFDHPTFKEFVVNKFETTIVQSDTSVGFQPPLLEEIHLASGCTIKFFQANGCSRGTPLSKADVRNIVTEYVKKKDLRKGGMVEVDPILHEAVVGPKEGYKEFLRWDEIFSRLLGKMSPAFRIQRAGQPDVVKKGKLEPIEMTIAKRAGNKRVTLLYNLGTFGIDDHEFAHQVQVGVATSTSVGPAENKPMGTTQVLIQGNQVAYVAKLLLDVYKIPRKYIRGLELLAKKKAK